MSLVSKRLALHEAQVARHGEAVAADRRSHLRVGHSADPHRREALDVWRQVSCIKANYYFILETVFAGVEEMTELSFEVMEEEVD